MTRSVRSVGLAATACAVIAALVGACGAGSPTAAPATPQPAPVISTPDGPPVTTAPAVPAGEDPAVLWETWKQLNVVCRGSSGPESVDACERRSSVQERQARLVADEFFAAWKRGDSTAMARLTHPDNASDTGWRIPAKLASYRPMEPAFDCRYDVQATTPFGCYTSVTGSGADLFVAFDIDDGRGWLARSFRPDV